VLNRPSMAASADSPPITSIGGLPVAAGAATVRRIPAPPVPQGRRQKHELKV